MQKSSLTTLVVLLLAILLAGNGLLVTHAASPNGHGPETGDHSNSGNGHNSSGSDNGYNSGSGTGGHSSGTNTGDSSQGTSNGDYSKTDNGGHSPQSLALGIAGGVMNAGTQQYLIQQSGHVVMGSFQSLEIDTTRPNHLKYNLDATVQGTSSSGYVDFRLSAFLFGGGAIDILGNGSIVGMMAAVCLPNYDMPNSDGSCPNNDTSAVPAMFIGMMSLEVTTGGLTNSMQGVPMLFESAYMNPFGGPIVLSTADKSVQLVTTYNRATVDWSNVTDAGMVQGMLGSTPVSGTFLQIAQEHENLVNGKAQDRGVMMFSGMTTTSLDVSVTYAGSSSTPTSEAQDCTALAQVPCTSYGFQSSGHFRTSSSGQQSFLIAGSYKTMWGIPAFSFTGTMTAVVS